MRRPSEMVSIDQAKELLQIIIQASQTYQRFLQANRAERVLAELKRQGALLASQLSALNAFFGLEDALQAAEIKPYHIKIFETIYPNFDGPLQQRLARFLELMQSLKAPDAPKKRQVATPSSKSNLFLALLTSSAFFLGVVVIALVLNFVLPGYGLLFAVSLFGTSVSLVKAVLIASSIVTSILLVASMLSRCLMQISPKPSAPQKVIVPPKNRHPRKSGFILKVPRKKSVLPANSPDTDSQGSSPPEVAGPLLANARGHGLARPAAISGGSPILFDASSGQANGEKTPARVMLTPDGSAFGTPTPTPARVRALASNLIVGGGPALFDVPLRLAPVEHPVPEGSIASLTQ